MAAKYRREHSTDFMRLLSENKIEAGSDCSPLERFERHCDEVESTSAWGGQQLELGALTHCLKKHIINNFITFHRPRHHHRQELTAAVALECPPHCRRRCRFYTLTLLDTASFLFSTTATMTSFWFTTVRLEVRRNRRIGPWILGLEGAEAGEGTEERPRHQRGIAKEGG